MDEEAKAAPSETPQKEQLPLMVGLLLKEINNSTISSNSTQGNLFVRLKYTHGLRLQKNPIL